MNFLEDEVVVTFKLKTKTGVNIKETHISVNNNIVDWSKVPIDTKMWVRVWSDTQWLRRHFAGTSAKGAVYCFEDGGTSWTKTGKTNWEHCKLAEEGEQ